MHSVRFELWLGLILYMCSDVLCLVILIEYVFGLVFSAVNRAPMYCDGDTICYVLTIPPSTSAPPLTVENVLKHMNVQEVRNWRTVGYWLLPGDPTKQLDAIERKYSSVEDRMRAVVQQWLQGGYLRSWRTLACLLDKAGDIEVADPIRGFTEPPRGESS